jgi:hypothetical protein
MVASRRAPRSAPTREPLGGLAEAAFLRRILAQEALLVRAAMPGFTGRFETRSSSRWRVATTSNPAFVVRTETMVTR